MRLGIVGHGDDKFTRESARRAIAEIRAEIVAHEATVVVSGRSPLGGVDVWAETIAREHGLDIDIKVPRVNSWGAPGGFKDRNLAIAQGSDKVICVVVDDWPSGYAGRRFRDYHCKGRGATHVKSGGCWTAWKARERAWVVIPQEPGHTPVTPPDDDSQHDS